MLQIITTHEELQDTINKAVRDAMAGINTSTPATPQKSEQIKGINGLAAFLQCSPPTAQKIKNSGRIRYYQSGRTLIFKSDEVLADIASTRKRNR